MEGTTFTLTFLPLQAEPSPIGAAVNFHPSLSLHFFFGSYLRSLLQQSERKITPIPLSHLVELFLDAAAILLLVFPLHFLKMGAVPVEAHKAGDEKLVAELDGLVV